MVFFNSSKFMIFLFNLMLCVVYGQNHDICPALDNEICRSKNYENGIVCNGGILEEYKQKDNYVHSLSLCHWPDENFDPQDILSRFLRIEFFILFKSRIKEISNDFPELLNLKVLNISHLSIEHLNVSVFSKLTYLNVLDLRYNKLRFFDPNVAANLIHLKNIYLAGNDYYCGEKFSWITSSNNSVSKLISDVDLMVCGGFKYGGKPLKQVTSIIDTLKYECRNGLPANCTCGLDHVIRVGKNLRPMITVNCSNQHLKTLPQILPNFTSTLIMRGNMVSNLNEFITNESYFKLLNVYLDYNNISSINILAGSSWLLTFRALSLKGNNLSEIPIYALENAFEKNRNIGKFLLSENPWKCDCVFTPVFKDFLAKYRSLIKDVSNIKCNFKEDAKNSLVSVLFLNRNKICRETVRYNISFFNILSIIFATLLILVLIDFAYNYYMYKKYSQLPWIANKLP